MTPLKFLLKMPDDAKIISSCQMTEMQIAFARAENRFFIDKETGYGWAIVKDQTIT